MKNNGIGWILGGLLGASVLGLTFAVNVGSAAEKNAPDSQCMMMQKGQMGNMDMHKMMNSLEMQKQCLEMLKNPQIQKSISNMLKTPEMQVMSKKMLSGDTALRQMMLDLVNSIDPNDQDSTSENTQTTLTPAVDHSTHK